jgi:hypothetical protein
MILETAQLLCSVHYMLIEEEIDGIKFEYHLDYSPPYKLTHKNHPCAIWARQCVGNYLWLVELGLELCYEYSFRYSNKIHKTQAILEELKENIPLFPYREYQEFYPINFQDQITQPPQAMPDEYKDADPIIGYRNYYKYGKSNLHSWKNREIPNFI